MSMMEKNAQVMTEHLLNGEYQQFKLAFENAGSNLVRTKVKETSFAEEILDTKTVTETDPNIQKDINTDTFVYVMNIEKDAVGAWVGFRAEDEPVFIDGKRMPVKIGKIESEPVKKPKMELLVASDIIKMINENNVEAISRTQDTKFLELCDAIVDSDAVTGPISKVKFVSTMAKITDNELIPTRWLMSNTAWNNCLALDSAEIDSVAGQVFVDGMPKKRLLGLDVKTSVKNGLFKKDNGSEKIYIFTDPEYLGKLIKIGTDTMWSEWKKDIFHWASWRYVGMGIGNTKSLARFDSTAVIASA